MRKRMTAAAAAVGLASTPAAASELKIDDLIVANTIPAGQRDAELEAAKVAHVQDNPEAARRTGAGTGRMGNAPNEKFIGPDWVHIDVRERGWNEAIRSNTQLYELTPVTSDR